MFTSRVGIYLGSLIGSILGSAGDDEGPGADLLIFIWGQSNAVGFSDYARAGTTTTQHNLLVGQSAGDAGPGGGMGMAIPLTACRYMQDWQFSGTNPLAFTTITNGPLKNYAAAGQAQNTGIANALGRAIIRSKLAINPAIAVCGIGSTSIPHQWAPTSAYPGSGEKLYDHIVAYAKLAMATFGRPIDLILEYIGETDAAVVIDNASCQADRTAFYTAFRPAIGLLNVPILATIINSEWDATPGSTANYQTAQLAWATADGKTTTFDPSFLDLGFYPHYLMGGYCDLGEAMLVTVRDMFKPGKSLNLEAGPRPWYQGRGAAFTAQSGTGGSLTTARPRGYADPKVGDIEILWCEGSPIANSITLTTAANFVACPAPLDVQINSVNGGAVRSLRAFQRTITQPMLDVRLLGVDGVRRGPCAIPVVDFGAGTANSAVIHSVRGASAIDVCAIGNAISGSSTPIGTFTTTANNSLGMVAAFCNQLTGQITSVTGGLAASTVPAVQESQFNPGAAVINMAITYCPLPTSGVIAGSTVIFGSGGINSVNVGAVIVFKP